MICRGSNQTLKASSVALRTVSQAFMDKFSLTYACTRDVEQGIRATLRNQSDAEGTRLYYLGPALRGYRHSWHLILQAYSEAPILLQARLKYSPKGNFRVEWNPRHLGPEGNSSLWSFLEEVLFDEFRPFLLNAVVTRCDFAVDARPLTPDAIWVACSGLRRGKVWTGDNGDIESIELGARGSGTHYCIYNRNEETGHYISSDLLTTRIEAQVRPDRLLRYYLVQENPFERLTLVNAVDQAALNDAPDRFQLFMDSIRVRGLQGALQRIRRYETRCTYRDWLVENLQADWFNPEEIWPGLRHLQTVLSLPPPVRRRRRSEEWFTSNAI